MRHITVSIFAFLLAMPAFADARLPVVNLASAGVSARAAFGESVPTTKQLQKRNVVARPTVQRTATPAKTANATVATSNDILIPNRPSNDLWARNSSSLNASVDAPLRMPKPSEFAVYRSDEILPEESLDTSTMPKTYAYNDDAPVAPTRTAAAKKSELDAQIERLVELQRRADESVTPTNVAPRVIARPVVDEPIAPSTDDVRVAVADATPTETVNVRRMVVPMETRDVVVRSVEKNQSPRIAAVRDDMTKLSPSELRRAFRKTFLSENKHLSTYQMDDSFDVVSDMDTSSGSFTSSRDLSEDAGIRPLEIKINFRNDDSSLSRDNYNLLSEYAAIVVHNPTRAIQIAIPARATTDADARKLTARRLAIVEQVLRDTGVSMQRIVPVLSQRDEAGFVLRVISNEQYESLSQQKRNIFGDTVSSKKYKSLTW